MAKKCRARVITMAILERSLSVKSFNSTLNVQKIFVNKFSNGSGFYRRISPTSFYPMQVCLANPNMTLPPGLHLTTVVAVSSLIPSSVTHKNVLRF